MAAPQSLNLENRISRGMLDAFRKNERRRCLYLLRARGTWAEVLVLLLDLRRFSDSKICRVAGMTMNRLEETRISLGMKEQRLRSKLRNEEKLRAHEAVAVKVKLRAVKCQQCFFLNRLRHGDPYVCEKCAEPLRKPRDKKGAKA